MDKTSHGIDGRRRLLLAIARSIRWCNRIRIAIHVCEERNRRFFLSTTRQREKSRIALRDTPAKPSQGQAPYYYAYGRPSSPELIYPPRGGKVAGAFAQTHLVYGGATGGTAYSFVNGDYKYILYSISGTGLDDSGVLVQRLGQTDAARDMKCQRGTITESDDDTIARAMQQWKSDPDLETHGLPSAH
jgi:hypothetical protein